MRTLSRRVRQMEGAGTGPAGPPLPSVLAGQTSLDREVWLNKGPSCPL